LEKLSGAPLESRLLALLSNFTRGWKFLIGANTLAYFPFVSDEKREFQGPMLQNFFVRYLWIFVIS
jgi:hypothetical protein